MLCVTPDKTRVYTVDNREKLVADECNFVNKQKPSVPVVAQYLAANIQFILAVWGK